MRALVAAALLLPLVQDGAVELRWKFAEGRALRYRMTQTIAVERSGRKLRQETATTYLMTVEKVHAGGGATIRMKYDAYRFDSSAPDRSYTYDSAKDVGPPAHPAARLQARLVGKSFTLDMTPAGRVKRVGGVKELVDALVRNEPDPETARASLAEMLSPDTLKSMFQQMAPALPDRKVARRDRWKDEYALAMPMVGRMDFTVVSELAGVEDGIARFDQEMLVEFEPGERKPQAEITAIRGKASNRFSLEGGMFLRSASTLDVTVKSGDAVLPMTVKGELRLLD